MAYQTPLYRTVNHSCGRQGKSGYTHGLLGIISMSVLPTGQKETTSNKKKTHPAVMSLRVWNRNCDIMDFTEDWWAQWNSHFTASSYMPLYLHEIIAESQEAAHTAHISTHLVELKSTHRVDFTSKSTYSVDLKMHKSTSTVDLGINIIEPSCHISIVFSCEWLPNPLSKWWGDRLSHL